MYNPETDMFELEKDKPLVLLLGDIGHEGVISTLKTTGRQYKSKYLESRPANWQSIIKYFDEYIIECVLMKLSPNAISLMSSEDYDDIGESLFARIGTVPNIVFVYEDILTGQGDDEYYSDSYSRHWKESRIAGLEMLERYNLHVMPYKKNAEVTIMAELFLSETEQHLIFRLYVPSSRIWSNESEQIAPVVQRIFSKGCKSQS